MRALSQKLKYRTGAIYHATTSVLQRQDKLQDKFLRDLGITIEAALMDSSVAPLSLRRDTALLGLLHRAAIGEGPPQFLNLFKRKEGSLCLHVLTMGRGYELFLQDFGNVINVIPLQL